MDMLAQTNQSRACTMHNSTNSISILVRQSLFWEKAVYPQNLELHRCRLQIMPFSTSNQFAPVLITCGMAVGTGTSLGHLQIFPNSSWHSTEAITIGPNLVFNNSGTLNINNSVMTVRHPQPTDVSTVFVNNGLLTITNT